MSGRAKVFFFLLREWQHVDLFVENLAYDMAFAHDVLVELRHGVRPAVDERWGLVLRILCHSVYTEPRHLVTVNNLRIALAGVLRWCHECLEVGYEQKRHLVLFVARMKLECGV